MSGRISDYLVTQWLSELNTCYLALHYDNPDVAGAYASEVFGSGYSRQLGKFSFPDARAIWNVETVAFSALPAVTVTHVAGWDAKTGGNLLWSADLDTPIRVLAGRQIAFAPQLFAVSLD